MKMNRFILSLCIILQVPSLFGMQTNAQIKISEEDQTLIIRQIIADFKTNAAALDLCRSEEEVDRLFKNIAEVLARYERSKEFRRVQPVMQTNLQTQIRKEDQVLTIWQVIAIVETNAGMFDFCKSEEEVNGLFKSTAEVLATYECSKEFRKAQAGAIASRNFLFRDIPQFRESALFSQVNINDLVKNPEPLHEVLKIFGDIWYLNFLDWQYDAEMVKNFIEKKWQLADIMLYYVMEIRPVYAKDPNGEIKLFNSLQLINEASILIGAGICEKSKEQIAQRKDFLAAAYIQNQFMEFLEWTQTPKVQSYIKQNFPKFVPLHTVFQHPGYRSNPEDAALIHVMKIVNL